jgi:plasmid stabilization system protein ParE
MAEIIVSPRAASDAHEIYLYLAQHSRAAAGAFIEQLAGAFERLAAYPMIGAPRDGLHPGIRMLVIERYLLVHRLRDDCVEIVTIFDGRRDPAALEAIIRDA